MAEKLQGPLRIQRHDDGRVEVLEAPGTTYMSLEFLFLADKALVRVSGREVCLAGQVSYRVTGWDNTQSCLVLERIGKGI